MMQHWQLSADAGIVGSLMEPSRDSLRCILEQVAHDSLAL